ncbi:5-hydroxytryptamine receptor 3A-like [Denticeps clupeoides]|uniref:5-hydroxytryptamine receptor 3A-like n=1 Tax=Denticeps clupeoides TaxID=299321 RepID=UPI0010A2B471|nr:5-hydroxytryptamine receptor 3A-like [Denticeps clupeoides]
MQLLGPFLILVAWEVPGIRAETTCVTQRCLANNLVSSYVITMPQSQSCNLPVNLSMIDYQTTYVDTKLMQFSSLLTVTMIWRDPNLAWNKSEYDFDVIVLPASQIWTPQLTVKNAVTATSEPAYPDVMVSSDGDVEYAVLMAITVSCNINLFTYPFVTDSCPVAINGWNDTRGCGLSLEYGTVQWIGGNNGDWETKSVTLQGTDNHDNRNYLNVTVSIRPFSPFVTLVMPSILIMLADLASAALPFEGGERNTYKVTLVLSFIMFLNALTQGLPDDGPCSPVIRYHYCLCLVVLVVSLLVSLVLSRLDADGSILPCKSLRCSEGTRNEKKKPGKEGVSVLTVTDSKEHGIENSLLKVLSFLEDMEQHQEAEYKRKAFTTEIDKICFWIYLCFDIIYAICMLSISQMNLYFH